MKYEQIETLEAYLETVEAALLGEDCRLQVLYMGEHVLPWDAEKIEQENLELLDKATGRANVYAIFTASKDSHDFSLRYIGKTTRKLARQRVRNHLVKKHVKTGAKLEKIVAHVQSGGLVKISWVRIEPESLRNYVEEELIRRHRNADWNRENTR